jgi:hypothetical protein
MKQAKLKTVNDREPNFRDDSGRLFLVKCFACAPKFGRENKITFVYSGECAWCGWKEEK